jgi:hypothetical protein
LARGDHGGPDKLNEADDHGGGEQLKFGGGVHRNS